MMTQEEQERLTRVGPETPMGKLLRCYWHPLAASSEIGKGKTKAVRLLCEDLVLFRKLNGDLGLIKEHCPHRGTSLRCAAVDDQGIICPYHGWKFDDKGQCLEMPAEKFNPAILQRAKTIAYPVAELGGLIFAYLGVEPVPLLPRYDVLVKSNVIRDIGYALLPCNWLQIMENSVDPVHVEWLHGHHLTNVRANAGKSVPTHYRKHHLKIGFDTFRYGIIKRRIVEGGKEEDDDWQIGHPLIFPTALRVGSQFQHRMQFRVPVDDTHTLHFWYSSYVSPNDSPLPLQADVPFYEVPWRDAQENYIVDYVDGGDIMTWVSQGPIVDRTRELLVSSDKGIALYRKLLAENIIKVQNGEDPMGIIRDEKENECIHLQQEKNKYNAGFDFLKESIEMSHARYSPLKELILELWK